MNENKTIAGIDLDKLEALASAATPGKRRSWSCRDGDHDYMQIAAGREHIAQVRIASAREADFRLIEALDPTTVLQLIQLARKATSGSAPNVGMGEPVAWLEAEPSARGRPAHEVAWSMLYSSRIHTKCAPMTSNPVWPLYALEPGAPQQASQKGEE